MGLSANERAHANRQAEVQLRLCDRHHRRLPYHYYDIMAFKVSFGDKNYGLQAGIINGAVEFNLPPGTFWDRLKSAGPERALTDPASRATRDSTTPINCDTLSPRRRLRRARNDTRPHPSNMRRSRFTGRARGSRRRWVCRAQYQHSTR